MSSYAATYDRQSAPEANPVVSYEVRVPGQVAWASGISGLKSARDEQTLANRVCQPGHVVIGVCADGARRRFAG